MTGANTQAYIKALIIVFILLLGGCKGAVLPPAVPSPPVLPAPPLQPVPPVSPGPALPLELISDADLPDISDDLDFDSMRQAALHSISYLERKDPTEIFEFGHDRYTRDEMLDSLRTLVEIIDVKAAPGDFVQTIKERFSFYRSSGLDGKGAVLFTGYYLPVLKGRRECRDEFIYPAYGRPGDLFEIDIESFGCGFPKKTLMGRSSGQKIVPYYTRHEIDCDGALKGLGYELVYVSDAIDLFFLQIQGSGLVELDTGETLFVQYEAANGHPYRSIGNLLIEEGKMKSGDVSLFSLKDYLENHPEEREKVLCYNSSYVFFRIADTGPRGSLGEILTAGRSIATDRRIFPKGAIALIACEKPVLDGEGTVVQWAPFTRVAFNQDTGGAIKGPGRVDVFWGSGDYAEKAAGYMKHKGQLFFLVKKRAY
ncbi:MAG: MltA domain-containing protein [Pseudomonadota bacterium]